MGTEPDRFSRWMRSVNRPLPLVFFVAVTLLALSAVLAAESASAARYTVAQCGWHVGQDAGWAETSADKFSSSSYCQTPVNADPFENVHLSSSTRGSTASVSGTRFARWRWSAPAGTGIVTQQLARAVPQDELEDGLKRSRAAVGVDLDDVFAGVAVGGAHDVQEHLVEGLAVVSADFPVTDAPARGADVESRR